MYWYDFGRNDVYVGNGGKFDFRDCKKISAEEKEKVKQFFSEHLDIATILLSRIFLQFQETSLHLSSLKVWIV